MSQPNRELQDVGQYTVEVDDVSGKKFWIGGMAGDKQETCMNEGESVALNPEHFAVGTELSMREPMCEQCFGTGVESESEAFCGCPDGDAKRWQKENDDFINEEGEPSGSAE